MVKGLTQSGWRGRLGESQYFKHTEEKYHDIVRLPEENDKALVYCALRSYIENFYSPIRDESSPKVSRKILNSERNIVWRVKVKDKKEISLAMQKWWKIEIMR
jgi:hypothetical protein